jgi:hypothetical protein
VIRPFARACRVGFVLLLLLAAGCTASAPRPSTPAPVTVVTLVPQPAVETPAAAAPGSLMVEQIPAAPIVDGQVDSVWASAVPLRVPLTWGIRGTEHAMDVELRALHTSEAIYFLVQWPDATPSIPGDATANMLTLHWSIDTPAGIPPPACDVACHTVFTDAQGRLAYIHSQTIPSGIEDALPAGGGWKDGAWTLEWSRLLVNDNPYDLQFTNLSRGYPFFVKVFKRVEDRPDPVSAPYLLIFEPPERGPSEASQRSGDSK